MKSNVLTYKDWYKLNESNSGKLIFSGGLDNRSGDKDLAEQISMFDTKINKEVIGFRYSDSKGLLEAIETNPGIPVLMFSAGCQWSRKVAKAVSNKNLVYIVEPYHSGGNTTKSVQDAIKEGVPSSNVMAGPSSSRGKGIVEGHQNTEKGTGHWDSLPYAAKLYITGSTGFNRSTNSSNPWAGSADSLGATTGSDSGSGKSVLDYI
jgi:hypothetical protein